MSSFSDQHHEQAVALFRDAPFVDGSMQQALALLAKAAGGWGAQIIGISPDDMAKHKKFEKKFSLPFPLLADPKHAIIEKYGVWGEKQMFGNKYMGLHRTTFVIDEKGIIQKIFLKPKSASHAEEIISKLNK